MSILVKECTSILGITLLTALPKLLLNDWVLTWVPIVVMHRQGTICRLAFGDHWADDLSELSCPLILHSLNTCLVQTNEQAGAGSWGSFTSQPIWIICCTLSHPEAPPAAAFISQAVTAFEDRQRSSHTIRTEHGPTLAWSLHGPHLVSLTGRGREAHGECIRLQTLLASIKRMRILTWGEKQWLKEVGVWLNGDSKILLKVKFSELN